MLQQYEIQAPPQEVLKYKLLDARKIKKDADIKPDHHHRLDQKKQY
jgi:hypothetical protein